MAYLDLDGNKIDIDAQLRDLDRADCEESLYEFLRHSWKYIDSAPFTDGWPIEAVAEHLQAVVDGQIRKLIINIPPRCAKSSLTSVAFPAWTWAQPRRSHTSGPGVSFLTSSYAGQLSLRHSVKARRLIDSPWYKSLWGDRFQLRDDQNTKSRFDNSEGGSLLATSVGSALTGEGGNIIVIDDPNSAQDAFSEAKIEETLEWWTGALSTRLNDPKQGAFVLIQQRLSEEDLTGYLLSKEASDWVHLCLPMRFEKERSFQTVIGWEDPRTEEGELLWPERFGDEEVKELEVRMGPWKAAGQLQQRPEPKGGGIIKRDWWQLWERESFPPMEYVVAALDTAYTTKEENDFSALTVWGVFSGGDQKAMATRVVGRDQETISVIRRTYTEEHPRLMLMYAWQERLELHELVQKVEQTIRMCKVDKLIIENKAAGISVSQEIRRMYGHEDFVVQLVDPKGVDKTARLHSVAPLFAEGLVYAPDRSWADTVITQVTTFPKAKHDDLVDTVAMAVRHMRELGLLVRGPERLAEFDRDTGIFGGNLAPLYDA